LRLDAIYLNRFYVVVYKDDFDGYTQLLLFSNKEDYTDIREVLENLIQLEIQLENIITNGY